jgi:hypothetical protein
MLTTSEENWFYAQCLKWGRVALDKAAIASIFGATKGVRLKELKAFCVWRKLKVKVDQTGDIFTFILLPSRAPATIRRGSGHANRKNFCLAKD